MASESREIIVTNENGLHARPAMQFVDTANLFASDVRVLKQDEDLRVDGKSVMQMLTLVAVPGTKLVIEAEGEDAVEAVASLLRLFESNFGEDS